MEKRQAVHSLRPFVARERVSPLSAFDFRLQLLYAGTVKRVVLCDNHAYYISDEDYEILKRAAPGYARLAKDADGQAVTHFVCAKCGQIAPLKLRKIHDCRR